MIFVPLIDKMLVTFLRFFKMNKLPNTYLGRWGYHWDKTKMNTYYD